jgi:hypothetical protein
MVPNSCGAASAIFFIWKPISKCKPRAAVFPSQMAFFFTWAGL